MKNIFVAMLLLVGTFCSAANDAKPAVEAKPAIVAVSELLRDCKAFAVEMADLADRASEVVEGKPLTMDEWLGYVNHFGTCCANGKC
jgi:hypothetical protein